MSSKTYFTVVAILFSIYFINGIIAIPKLSVTGDEGDHLNYAMRFAKLHPEKIKPFDDASTMPISVFNTLPRAAEQLLHPSLKKTDWGVSDVFSGRYMTLLISALIGLYLLKFSTELYGRKAGLLSLFLFVFCPNINGHAVLVTTDAYSALFTLTSAWYFRKALLNGGWKYTLLFGIHLGLAQLAKQSLTYLCLFFLLLLAFYIIRGNIKLKTAAGKLLVAAAMVVLIINTGFQFKGTGTALNEYSFRSGFFKSVRDKLSFAGSLPLPLPEPYLSGLDLTKNIDEIGPGKPESSGDVYILGKSKAGEGFWYYYFVVLFFKTPVPVIACFLVFLFYLRKRHENFFTDEFIFLGIIACFLIYFNFFYNSQVGIRHIIMIYPLLYLLLGKIAGWLYERKVMAAVLAVYSVATFYYYFPNLIAYSNEFVLPKRNAYKIMADSNLDFGQSNFLVQQYLKKHPDTRMADTIPAAGKQLLRIRSYLDLNHEGKYEWLRSFKPVGQVAHSYLLFDIKKEQIGE